MKSLYEIWDQVVRLENNAEKLYIIIGTQASSEIQKTALEFQQEERKHAQDMEALRNRTAGLQIPDKAAELINAAVEDQEQILSVPIEFVKVKDLVLQALRWEREAMDLYTDIAALLSSDYELNRLFTELAVTERKHMYRILNLIHQMKGMADDEGESNQ